MLSVCKVARIYSHTWNVGSARAAACRIFARSGGSSQWKGPRSFGANTRPPGGGFNSSWKSAPAAKPKRPPPAGKEHVVRLEKVIYRREDYFIISVVLRQHEDQHDDAFVVQGNTSLTLREGQILTVQGETVASPQYGLQFKANYISEEVEKMNDSDMALYLESNLTGVGPKKAEAIVAALGGNAFKALDSPAAEEVLSAIKTIGPKLAKQIMDEWRTIKSEVRQRAPCMTFMDRHRIPERAREELLARFPDGVEAAVKRDPFFALQELPLMGFVKIDKIAFEVLGDAFDPLGMPRVSAAIRAVLDSAGAGNGHTFLLYHELEGSLYKLLAAGADSAQAHVLDWGETNEAIRALVAGLAGRGQGAARSADPSETVLVIEAGGEEGRESAEWPAPMDRVYLRQWYEAEDYVARSFSDCLARSAATAGTTPTETAAAAATRAAYDALIDKVLADFPEVQLSADQREAVLTGCTTRLGVITGGPGTGKTSTLKVLVEVLKRRGTKVALAAPSGTAAKRLADALGNIVIPPASKPSDDSDGDQRWRGNVLGPMTVHRLVGFLPPGATRKQDRDDPPARNEKMIAYRRLTRGLSGLSGEATFGPGNELECSVCIVDEASMLDLATCFALLSACASGTRFIFVGDKDQLPPIGPGAVFNDLMQLDSVPRAVLTETYRFQEGIAAASRAAKERTFIGAALTPVEVEDIPTAFKAGHKALWVEFDSREGMAGAESKELSADTVRVLSALVGTLQGMYKPTDIQVLVPMRKKVGTPLFNRKLQELMNKPSPQKGEMPRGYNTVFRVGDRVIQMSNNYEKDVFNGMMGVVTGVRLPTSAEKSPAQKLGVDPTPPVPPVISVVFDDTGDAEHRVSFEGGEIDEIEHSWAVTVHKAQGGEFPCVVLFLDASHGRMLHSRLLYTALSRPSSLLVVVASERALRLAEGNSKDDLADRNNRLLERIEEARAAAETAAARRRPAASPPLPRPPRLQ